MNNQEVAEILDEIGDMLEIQGEITFKVQAYHRAANAIRSFPEDINRIWQEGRLKDIRGVGESIAEKVDELLSSGRLSFYEELREKVPPSLLELMQIPGIGPKKAKIFYEKLGITTIDELLQAIELHRIAPLRDMGAKTEENILRGVHLFQRSRERILLFEAHLTAEKMINDLKKNPFVKNADAAGSLRRMKETIGDIDILVASSIPEKVADTFCSLREVGEVLVKGETKCSVVVKSGLQVDLRVVAPDSYGAALQYFTGSKEHNIHLREIAKKKGLKVNEYGIFEIVTDKKLGGKNEEDIYRVLGMDYIPPTLREDKGEIEASFEKRLPHLVELKDIRSDLHVHSVWSDGSSKIEDLVKASLGLGYEYLGLCDHALRLKVARGMDVKDVENRLREIKEINEKYSSFTVLNGVELNIENDGTVDYSEEILAQFDLVTASIH
ncbi:MAG: helix-hairpin-helix domain-containing protein [Candidatus Subteraquimicrobiales bacterium]|nr:helix-hairpin-helix domain-containing protein [Candidatus Subteraquimicrobiales bacterium]